MHDDDPGFADATTIAQRRLEEDSLLGTAFRIVVVEGPDTGGQHTIEPAHPTRILLGTSEACEFRLTDPRVSRRHAALEARGRRLRISDLDSTNGTDVDGVSVLDAYLRGGETIRVGSTALRVERSEESQTQLPAQTRFGGVMGASAPMRRLYPLCERLAQTDVPVIIEGETGTGKERLAEALHEEGPRRDEPFLVFDCAAVPPNLFEAQLFGHEKGAFTGAVGRRTGVFEEADGGTLLIDEIGDLPLDLQPKLLRVVERSEVTRVGGSRPCQVNVRLIAATRRNLDEQVQRGQFRDDLFHRIAVTRIELPPLRNRHGDITLLARHFWTELSGRAGDLPQDVLAHWEHYPWPGNVRELRNAVFRKVALGDLADMGAPERASRPPPALGESVAGGDADAIARILSEGLPLADARQRIIDEFERRYVRHLLELHQGNVTRAAAAAGVARRHLQRLKAKGLDR